MKTPLLGVLEFAVDATSVVEVIDAIATEVIIWLWT